MEVHIGNVPEQATDNGLRNFLKPHLLKLSIQSFHCQKQREKRFASLTFLNASDGERFLAHHGQARTPPAHGTNSSNRHIISAPASNSIANNRSRGGRQGASNHSGNLNFLNKPIYCEKSNRPVNGFLIRVLEREEKQRQQLRITGATLAANNPRPHIPRSFPLSFKCSFASCGVWTYADSDLVYAPQARWGVFGTVKFRERDMILKFSSGHSIEFRYAAIFGITMETGSIPSFIVSMREPARFFFAITDPVSELMAQLNLQGLGPPQKRHGPSRHRLPSLNAEHEPIAGMCMVYRIVLDPSGNDQVEEQMHSLRNAHDMPQIIHRRTRISGGEKHVAAGFKHLQDILSGSSISYPFALRFQVQKLVQNCYLLPDVVLPLIPEITRMTQRSPAEVCVAAVRKLFAQISYPGPDTEAEDFEPESIIALLQSNEKSCNANQFSVDRINTQEWSENVAVIHRVKITPAGTYLYGPEPESNNRILRMYPNHHDYFLRVQFCDEDGQPVRFSSRVSQDRIFNGRFKKVLQSGITIADRVYTFLGFSHSSLRAQSCWFMAPFIHNGSMMLSKMIIRKLGNFTVIRSPAKCAARIGQTFSDTRTAVFIDPKVLRVVKDVEFNNRVFSDGVGTMSVSVMHKIWDQLKRRGGSPPTVFQIRFAGAKGMISLDSRLRGDALVLRPSMIKFKGSSNTDIEICEAAWKPLPLYLNRQFIKILEDMGTPDRFFLDLQAKEVERLRIITESSYNASSFLKRQSVGEVIHLPWLINKLSSLNLNFRTDGFLRNILELTLLLEVRVLKHKTRIPVPKGWHLHGIMDETGFLEEGQIFCIIKDESGTLQAVTGSNLIISRAPALHPGDVQLVTGVMPPRGSPLRDLHNCIVFSQKGSRDLPSQLSGGDLDGDRYYLIWDKAARPNRVFQPADYPRVDPIDIGRQVETEDMTDFFIQFMETDQLGRIAVMHRILADQKESGTLDPDCCTLAEMHSTAVDFSKTGIPVDMTRFPRYNPWRPDFEAPGPHVAVEKKEGISFDAENDDPDADGDEDDDFTRYRYYESQKVLGKLYRAIDEREIFSEIQERARTDGGDHNSTVIYAVWEYVKRECRLIQWQHKKEWARGIRDAYEECLLSIMTEYSDHPRRRLTELEAFVGNILGRTGAQTKSQRELSVSLKEKFDSDAGYFVNCIIRDGEEYSVEALERSMACLDVSLENRLLRGREQLLSFKYLAAAVCLREVERL